MLPRTCCMLDEFQDCFSHICCVIFFAHIFCSTLIYVLYDPPSTAPIADPHKIGDKMEAPWAAGFTMSMAWLALFSYAVCVVADQVE